MKDDLELLRDYAANASEEAFATLVSRHIRLVYGAAMRHVGHAHEAEEITQAVFIILARKAGQLPRGTVLSGWLFQTTRLTARNHLRNEARRRSREQEAHMQSNLEQAGNDDVWRQVAPMLDSAIASLGLKDRNAVVLRFVEGREIADVGEMLGATESAAQKRINRAVDKLRKFFTKRGVVLTGAVLASSIAANAAPAAPATLTTSVATIGALKGVTAGASTLGLIEGTLKVMAWAKLKLAAGIGAGVALATGTAIVAITHVAEASHTRNEVATLSPDSPFVRHLLNPPWIKKMLLARGSYAYGLNGPAPPGETPHPTWNVITQTVALQPSGMYVESFSPPTGSHYVSGVNDQIYWEGDSLRKYVLSTPVAPEATFQTPGVVASRPRIEELRHLGLPALRPGTFAMQDGSKFTATTLKDEPVEGQILKVSNGRPLALTYHVVRGPGSVDVTVTYQYASATAPLPARIGHTETGHYRQIRDGVPVIINDDRADTTTTNWILSVEYGLDASVTNGYSPSRFFKDVDQYTTNVNYWSNGTAYMDGVPRPSRFPPAGLRGGPGAVTNQANK